MSKAAKKLYKLSEEQLGKLVGQGKHPGAQDAWDRARKIREAGGNPITFYSEFNGFTILDDDDLSEDTIRRVLSMEHRSKPFPG